MLGELRAADSLVDALRTEGARDAYDAEAAAQGFEDILAEETEVDDGEVGRLVLPSVAYRRGRAAHLRKSEMLREPFTFRVLDGEGLLCDCVVHGELSCEL